MRWAPITTLAWSGRVGSCFDRAASEAFNSVLKVEYVHRHTFATRAEARIRIATWITDFYNARPATQRVRLQEPDRLRTRPPSQPHRRTGCIGRSPRSGGLTW
ncbi:integrase core domain-containing protein [Streptomyces ferralitis]|uniref:Integrase core domain-containing protein n=1 Tax=Streptantibioticus ferralitis TaxID=236510 RepID=A0ABT5Z1N2_9ACTN|nr:integrase core domain-containing protein [Streptantibioticus ferralitis]MDF2257751.1 integrase core domain-containing protein [Streptantibioticus ferralitis]